MKRNFFISLCICTIATLSLNAKTIRDLFFNEPNNIFMLIEKSTRMDMLDYFDDGRIVSAKNNLGHDSQLIAVKPDFIAIQTSASSKVEMQLFKVSQKDSVIAVIQTAYLPGKDSHINFYDTRWKMLDKKRFFTEPTISDFVKNKKHLTEVMDLAVIPLISYSLNPDEQTLIAHQNLDKIVNKEDYAKIAPYLNDSLVYSTKKAQIKLIK